MRAYDMTAKLQDLRRLSWSESGFTSGTGGTFLKASEGQGTGRVYYKLSAYDPYRGVFGHECVNEIVASRLMSLLGVDHLRYQLVHAEVVVDGREFETWVCRSKSYRKSSERKQALDAYFRRNAMPGESPLEMCDRLGWGTRIRQMMLVDFLIANRDRHGANVEVIRGYDGSERLAPLFDNGVSLLFSTYGDGRRIASFDVLEDVGANNFVGTRSLEENLRFLAGRDLEVNPVEETWKEPLLAGLDLAAPEDLLEAVWDMVWRRWNRFALLRDR